MVLLPSPEDGADRSFTANTQAKPVFCLKRFGYYSIPDVKDLLLDDQGNCMVTDFTIGREAFGKIVFPGVVNVAGLNLDEIVFIRHKEVVLYPNEEKKPAFGEGLNRKATITVQKIWPVVGGVTI